MSENVQTELVGTYDHTIFSSEESGFTVGVLNTPGRREGVTLVGPYTAAPGETLKLKGQWIHNRKFGEQFEVTTYESQLPASVEGLRKYLGSGLIKGIGPVYADRLIERFGADVPQVIEETPHRLYEVEGIGKVRFGRIVDGWNAQKAIKSIMIFLQSHGVGVAFATRIYKTYRDEAIAKVSENPYRLARDIHGIGFKTADRIAQTLGVSRESTERREAAVEYCLREMADRAGHCYLPEEELLREVSELVALAPESIREVIGPMSGGAERRIVRENTTALEGARIYLRSLHEAELAVGHRFLKLAGADAMSLRKVDWNKFFEWYREKYGITLTEEQQRAVTCGYEKKVTVITGGPGTGKSTIIKALTTLFEKLKFPSLLAAPTGRAAKRMAEITGQQSKTLHRLLEFEPKTWEFRRGVSHPLDCELLIVDEVSMIDLPLFRRLLEAVPLTSRLVLVGDIDQLPSVGPGTVLKDLIDSGCSAVVTLKEIFRQAQDSDIVRAAHRINRGEWPVVAEETAKEFFLIEKDTPEQCLKTLIELCSTHIPKRLGFNPLRDVQVLVPMNRGEVGTKNLNSELQKALNRAPQVIERGSRKFIVGDRVIQVRNNYDLEVFNGDIGFIQEVDALEGSLIVNFDGKHVTYESSDLDELDTAYAISIHKSQGSEFPAVVIPLLTQHAVMLQRNLIYTAVTRAKKLAIILGSRKALELAINNFKRRERYSALAERLRGLSVSGALRSPDPAASRAIE